MISYSDHKAYIESCEAYCRANYSEAEMFERLRIGRDYFLRNMIKLKTGVMSLMSK